MADNTESVTLNFQATGLSDLDKAKEGLKGYKEEAEKAKLAGNAAAQGLNESLAKLQQNTVTKLLGQQFGELATQTNNEAEALKGLSDELDKIGASKSQISAAASAFQSAKNEALELANATAAVATEIENAKEEAEGLASATDTAQSDISRGALGGSRRLINTVGSVANQVVPGSGEAFRLGGDVLEFQKDLPKVKELLDGVGVSLGELGVAGLVAAPAVIAMGAAIYTFNKGIEEGKKALDAAIDADNKYFQAVATLNSQQANDEIATLQKRNDAIKQETDKQQATATDQAQSTINQLSGVVEAARLLGGDTNALGIKLLIVKATVGDVTDNIDKLNKEYGDNKTQIDKLTQGLQANAFAANDLAEKQKAAAAKGDQIIIQRVEDEAKLNQEVAQLQRDGTQKELEQKQKAAKDAADLAIGEVNSIQKAIDAATARGEDTTAWVEKQAQYFNDYNKASAEALALSDATLQAQVKQNDADKEHIKIVEDSAKATQKYDEDLKKNQDDLNKGLADAQQKYNDTLVQIAEEGAKQAEAALEKLGEKQADLATSFGNTELDAQTKAQQQQADERLKYQQEEAKAARSHADALIKIQQDAKEREFNLILNRDFSGLFDSRRQTTDAMNAETQRYNQEEQARATSYANQETLDAEHYEQEEAQRQLNYQRQLQQTQLAYTREQAAIDKNFRDANTKALTAYNNEQSLLEAKYYNQYALLNQSIVAQLNLTAQGESGKLALEAQYWQQSQQLISDALRGASPTNNAPSGVGFGSGQNGSSSLDIPRAGSGGSSSSVSSTNNSRNVSVNLNQNITGGSNSTEIARAAANAVRVAIADLVN